MARNPRRTEQSTDPARKRRTRSRAANKGSDARKKDRFVRVREHLSLAGLGGPTYVYGNTGDMPLEGVSTVESEVKIGSGKRAMRYRQKFINAALFNQSRKAGSDDNSTHS